MRYVTKKLAAIYLVIDLMSPSSLIKMRKTDVIYSYFLHI